MQNFTGTLRPVSGVVISDVHLGTHGCHAEELLVYLQSIDPQIVVLNGDIIDIWAFKKRYFPASHIQVIRHILDWAQAGKCIYYITGNHDDKLRMFSDAQFGQIYLVDKLVLTIQGERVWFFHGDVFDVSVKHARWLAQIGGAGLRFFNPLKPNHKYMALVVWSGANFIFEEDQTARKKGCALYSRL